jgi:hypothetical protein
VLGATSYSNRQSTHPPSIDEHQRLFVGPPTAPAIEGMTKRIVRVPPWRARTASYMTGTSYRRASRKSHEGMIARRFAAANVTVHGGSRANRLDPVPLGLHGGPRVGLGREKGQAGREPAFRGRFSLSTKLARNEPSVAGGRRSESNIDASAQDKITSWCGLRLICTNRVPDGAL